MRRLVLLVGAFLALIFTVVPTKADSITMFDEASQYPIAAVGLALCPTTQSCNQSLSNAIASFYFSPQPTGGEFTIDASDPAFGPIAGYLSMTDAQIARSALYEAIVPFYWNSGPNPGSAGFFTASNPDINFYEGHFGQSSCVIDGISQTCGYPMAGREIDSLSIIVSPGGEMLWEAQGVGIVPEPSTLSVLALGLVIFAASGTVVRQGQKSADAFLSIELDSKLG